jgi:hypothetical protein
MRFKVMTLITAAAAAAALGPTLAAVGSAASADSGPCTPVAGTVYEYVTSGSTNYYVAATNHAQSQSHPELKVFAGNVPNSTAAFTRCTRPDGQFAFEHQSGGVTLALSNDPGDGSRMDLDLVTSSGPNKSMYWVQSGTNPYTYKNTDSGRYLRVSNQGLGQYFPVVAGANATQWTEGH